jgi:hypothetical protein
MKKVFLSFAVVAAFLTCLIYIFPDPDPYETGIQAMQSKNYVLAKTWMLKVPEKHPKYDDAIGMLDEEKGEIGVALRFIGRNEMEKEREQEEVANKELSEKKFENSKNSAQYSCKNAAVKAAKWDGSESDFTNKSEVYKTGEDTLRVVGRDVKFVNGFGAKRYAEYTGIYSMKTSKCTIINIAD